ncbi:MAG: hypothetical protein VX026_13350, partial [Myxococcota bacterium]|nr:hypothetical protein [Myxococcota bacterium]
MSRLPSVLSILLPVSLLGCSQEKETKTAIFLQIATDYGNDTAGPSLSDIVDRIYVDIDPETPFLDPTGTPYEEGPYQNVRQYNSSFTNSIETDDELELRLEIRTANWETGLPIIEITPSEANAGPFSFSGQGWLDKTHYLTSDVAGPVSFIQDEIIDVTLYLSMLDTPIGPCNNTIDDDADGFIDEADPDCTDGNDEVGYSDIQCSDGIDNDGDGLIDMQDDMCEDAFDDAEYTDCENESDDDNDGYTDSEDPDCA